MTISPLTPRLVAALALGVTVVSFVTARRDVSMRVDEMRRSEIERANQQASQLEPELEAPPWRRGRAGTSIGSAVHAVLPAATVPAEARGRRVTVTVGTARDSCPDPMFLHGLPSVTRGMSIASLRGVENSQRLGETERSREDERGDRVSRLRLASARRGVAPKGGPPPR